MATNEHQQNLFDLEFAAKPQGPVECLGMTFANDEKRREYFLEKLSEKLKDPEFRKIDGFPIGEDDDILALSDPPYYTACPNPFIEDFIQRYGKPYDANVPYSKEPFAADVSEGKNDPIYNAHSYHTKVPHKAIMRYILHYTEPGDIVFDGFCGTGMTGVAAQMCGDRAAVESLGYQVKPDGTVLRQETDENGKGMWVVFSKLGPRRAVLNDLSPAATFIAYNYNVPVDVAAFEREATRILKEVEEECGWMYETKHADGKIGRINHTVWSDVFSCPECSGEVVFWKAALDEKGGKVKSEFPCPHCHAELTKRNMDRVWTTKYDDAIKETIRQAKQVPVSINYSIAKKRYEKIPDDCDLALINKIDAQQIQYWFPTEHLPAGYNTSQPIKSHGITNVHHFYTKRALWELAAIWQRYSSKSSREYRALLLTHTAANQYASKMRRFRADKKGGGPLAGTLYVASLITPPNVKLTVERNAGFILKAFNALSWSNSSSICACQSNEDFIDVPSNTLDYMFVDPPFGSNLNYSELNYIWESWFKVWTNNGQEAIENKVQGKSLNEYRRLMTDCFKEAYRVLKPGRWMTVEFSNTKASVWNSIQTALTEAGFIVANVSALDKKQGSFKAVTTPTAVKQDLIISAYKPNGGFENRFLNEASTEEGVWDFVRTHLKYLPVIKKQGRDLVPVPERDPRILFDQMVAYYVRKRYSVPISSQEFQLGLVQRFPERDGMYFLPDQVAEYDKKRMTTKQVLQLEIWVKDESSAIQWLKQQLTKKPQTFQDIHPQFLKEIGGWLKFEKPMELSELLEQNFLVYDGKGLIPAQLVSWMKQSETLRKLIQEELATGRSMEENGQLATRNQELLTRAKARWYVPDPNEAGDRERLRERVLLKEFHGYTEHTKKFKLNEKFRTEAVRTGFKKAWQERDYGTIIAVARKIPDKILQEDPKLLMWYDQALTRMGEEA